ncbi:MAG TPA: peptidylprolyl isomerase [Chitinophagales bacterium]|nr:peptidylprolyl isomerase [Chitinophagales bacterium]
MKKLILFVTCFVLLTANSNNVYAKKKCCKKSKKKTEQTAVVDEAKGTATAAKVETKIKQPMDTTTYIVITTKFGDIKLKLYDETPQHKANFIKIVKDGVLDGTLFHRIIPEFMIQGGDPDSKTAQPGQHLGMGGLPYKVPAELSKNLIHKKGALAAARDGNPQKASSSTQFYIVAGKKYTEAEIQMLASRTGNNWTDEQKKIYMEQGGTPMLDMNYTVFGEVVEGLDIIDKIVSQPRDGSDRPNEDIKMTVKVAENK